MTHRYWRWFSILVPTAAFLGCRKTEIDSAKQEDAPRHPRAETVEVLFNYGSEKEEWVKAMTAEFHRRDPSTASGKFIHVKAVPMGSGEVIEGLINGTDQAVIASPASGAFIKLGNAKWRAKTGKDLIGQTENLVLSPVVIAMWKPMAEAIGWGILDQRLANLERREQSLAEIESDLTRIEAQIDLAMDNARMRGKSEAISANIDLVSQLLDDSIYAESGSSIAALDRTFERTSQ